MALTIEWTSRIEMWRRELARQCSQEVAPVSWEAFVTTELLTLGEARKRTFKPMRPGTAWGGMWEYGWFRCRVKTPREAAGRRLLIDRPAGAEGILYVNGRAAGSVGWAAEAVTLTRKAHPGETFDVIIELYAGHGPRRCEGGPNPPDRVSVPTVTGPQQTVKATNLRIWEEDAFQLQVDVNTLWEMRQALAPESLRQSEIDQGLRDFATIVDFECPREKMVSTFREARRRLAPLLACRNGTTAPQYFAFGHGHLDVAWLWPLAETERKSVRTLANQLALMEEYPEHRFLQTQPHLFTMAKRLSPELYNRVRTAVKRGQIIPEGGMWVEADTNIAGGEALIRQFVHGIRFFKEEFGVNSQILFLPDVFGYSGALPQILKGCGIPYFVTAKIFWNYNGGDPFPYNTFTWEGIDGSTVLSHLVHGYGGSGGAGDAIDRWKRRPQKDGISTSMFFYGHGDGGCGPTREHVENVLRLGNLEGVPRCKLAHPLEFFKDLEKRGIPDARYVGELYYQCHRGTYTSQARTKKGNRKSELGLREAEMWGAIAGATTRYTFPAARMDAAWKKVLLNHFHDVLPGSSIRRVYEEAEAMYTEVIETASSETRRAAGALVRKGNDVAVFNSLNWQRTALVEVPRGVDRSELAVQKVGGKTVAEVTVPSCGWTSLISGGVRASGVTTTVRAEPTRLENESLRVTFNRRGEITGILDKESDREVTSGVCNRMLMFKDVPSKYDAWDIDSQYRLTPVTLDAPAIVTAVASGPLVGQIRVERKLNDSVMTQDIVLRRGSRRIDFVTRIDWRERHRMLKVAFPVNVHSNEAVHEIQFGHLKRPNHESRPFDQDRFEVSHHKWSALVEEGRGCAVINDCKYGSNVVGSTIQLTLLRSPIAPDPLADQGIQEFTYSFFAWDGSFAESDVVREAYDLNVPVLKVPGRADTASILSVDAPNIVIEAVKPAEDGSRDVIVRLYECKRTATACTLRTALPLALVRETDMLERPRRSLHAAKGAIRLEFRPFEIKTLRFACRTGRGGK